MLTPSVALGLRHDGGDAETGFGLDAGAGLAFDLPRHGVRAALRGRGLAVHEAGGFRARGIAAEFAWDPAPATARGPSLTLVQAAGGPARGGAEALFAPGAPAAAASGGAHRFEARFGYGVPAGRFASVPELGLALSAAAREYILGWRLAGEGAGRLHLSAEARRVESGGGAEHRVAARLTARW